MPGAANCAVVLATPLATGIDPPGLNVTFAGPPYSNQRTVKPPLPRPPLAPSSCAPPELACRGIWRPFASVIVDGGAGRGARGFGNPSSVTFAVNLTGVETLAATTGATVIDGGLLGFPFPGSNGSALPPLCMICSLISSTARRSA